mmetsp:Transcript_19526/g.39420  ORF Transcript_19526/g.39420 Transcript_19526/m.39420 type:complete len:268 (+) Transcript_19526:581-1384(+)
MHSGSGQSTCIGGGYMSFATKRRRMPNKRSARARSSLRPARCRQNPVLMHSRQLSPRQGTAGPLTRMQSSRRSCAHRSQQPSHAACSAHPPLAGSCSKATTCSRQTAQTGPASASACGRQAPIAPRRAYSLSTSVEKATNRAAASKSSSCSPGGKVPVQLTQASSADQKGLPTCSLQPAWQQSMRMRPSPLHLCSREAPHFNQHAPHAVWPQASFGMAQQGRLHNAHSAVIPSHRSKASSASAKADAGSLQKAKSMGCGKCLRQPGA